MPPRIPNFPAHASLDVWQESWLLSRSSRTAGSAPGATTHDRPPALPRVTRDGALASLADGAAPVDERLRLGRAALSECLQAGGGCAGLLPARRAASSARPAPVVLPLRWPLPWTARRPTEPLRLGCLGSLYASDELRPPRSREPHRRRGQPACGPPSGGRSTPVRGGKRGGCGRRSPRWARRGRGG